MVYADTTSIYERIKNYSTNLKQSDLNSSSCSIYKTNL